MKKRRSTGDIAIEIMATEEWNTKIVGHGDNGLLSDIFYAAKAEGILKEAGSRGGLTKPHPINRTIAVLNALDKDNRFEKSFFRHQGLV